MRRVLGHAAIAVALFAAGWVCWIAGQLERRMADAHEQLALLRYGAAGAAYADVERSAGFAGRLPWVGEVLAASLRGERTAGDYWLARYDALAPPEEAGTVADRDAPQLALAANAAFRAAQRDAPDRQAALKRLDAAVKRYAEVLKRNPADADAAYNFEYLVRLRDGLSKSRPAGRREEAPRPARPVRGPAMAGDLPDGRTVHGDPGAPPPNTDMTQFKMHIPVRPDERQGGSDAGQGKEKVRKG